MVFPQPVHVVVQGVQAGTCQESGLTHASAKPFPCTMCLTDEGLRPNEHRAHRAAQAFAEAEGDAVEQGAIAAQCSAIAPHLSLNPGVPGPRAIQVKRKSFGAARL